MILGQLTGLHLHLNIEKIFCNEYIIGGSHQNLVMIIEIFHILEHILLRLLVMLERNVLIK